MEVRAEDTDAVVGAPALSENVTADDRDETETMVDVWKEEDKPGTRGGDALPIDERLPLSTEVEETATVAAGDVGIDSVAVQEDAEPDKVVECETCR